MSDLLNSASLVLIPSGYKEDVVYSAVPTDGSGDLSFTRASNGTRINSAGLVEVTPWNLAQYSEDFSNAYWTKNNIPVMAYNVATAPNGTMTADSIKSDSSSVYQSVSATTITVAPNSTVTLSIYIKKETSKTYFTGSYLYFTGGTTKLTYVLFDEVNGSINIIAPDEVSMVTSVESVGNWWRFIVTGTDTGNNTNLDFAFYGTLSQNGTSLNPGIGSVRTIWGAQVNIGSTAKPYFPTTDRLNVPRLTYQNGGGGCPSLLLEKQSTNLAFPSEDLTAWTSGGMTNTANITTSPDGTQNADKSTIGSTTRYYDVVTNSITTVNGTIYTTSFFAKKGTGIEAIYFYQGDGGRAAKWNLNNGVYIGYAPADGYNAFTSQTSENLGNGWYRFTATYTASSTGGNLTIGISTNTNNSITQISGNGTDFVYVWGLQYEASSYPTSYIPTTSASATRVADACSKTGISSLIGQTEGVMFADFNFEQKLDTSGSIVILLRGSSSEAYIYLTSSNVQADFISGGIQCSILGSIGAVGRKKIAFAYKQNDFALYMNGVQIGTDSSGTVGSLTALTIGSYDSPGYLLNSGISQAILFSTRLTNSELASLTTI